MWVVLSFRLIIKIEMRNFSRDDLENLSTVFDGTRFIIVMVALKIEKFINLSQEDQKF